MNNTSTKKDALENRHVDADFVGMNQGTLYYTTGGTSLNADLITLEYSGTVRYAGLLDSL